MLVIKNDVCGIYQITNKINGKIYIGQSIHIYQRWNEHRRHYKTGNSYLYKAIRYYGINNFSFEIIYQCERAELNRLERFYINKFHSNNCDSGYNLTQGGDTPPKMCYDNNPNAKMTSEDVWNIREAYGKLEHRGDVYQKYHRVISINTFLDIWHGKTWRGIHEDVYTKENKKFHRNDYNKILAKKHTIVVEDADVLSIRNIYNEGVLSLSEAYKEFAYINYNTFLDIWNGNTFKNIQSVLPNKRTKHLKPQNSQRGSKNNAAKLSDEQVGYIRKEKESQKSPMEVYRLYFSDIISVSSFYRVWNNETY